MDFAQARQNMIDAQIRTNKVTDVDIINAFSDIARENFVPSERRDIAYIDEDISIDQGRYMTEPMVLARMVEFSNVQANDIVLVVGAATGYSSAVFSRLGASIFALEVNKKLAHTAGEHMSDIACDNVIVVEGPLEAGWSKEAPYDVILVDGAIEELPESLLDQLGEGGRLLCVERHGSAPGQAMLYVKTGGVVSSRSLFDANIQPLPGFEQEKQFTL